MARAAENGELVAGRVPEVPDVLLDKPEIYEECQWIYQAYSEIDRDGYSGALLFDSMELVLDVYRVDDRTDRLRMRFLWRAIHRAESKAYERVRKEKKSKDGDSQGNDRRTGSRGSG